MKKSLGITIAALVLAGFSACTSDSGARSDTGAGSNSTVDQSSGIELAQVSENQAPDMPVTNTSTPATEANQIEEDAASEAEAQIPPEITEVSGQLIQSDGTPASGGVLYFVFQGRLNEIPHANPLEKVRAMAEEAVAVDAGGSFTLNMKPGNFAMVYDPEATDVPAEPGPESMATMKRLTPEQVQARIAAIKENAAKGLPIENGQLANAFVIENRYIRPPVSDFGELQLQSNAVVTLKAVDEAGELINFPATLRLRGKNGDIMEPHTPSVQKRAQYAFHDLMPQSYQVFALGTLPRPGAGDEISTPTVSNDQFIFTGEALTHDVVVEPETTE